jgi:hypothetical protein
LTIDGREQTWRIGQKMGKSVEMYPRPRAPGESYTRREEVGCTIVGIVHGIGLITYIRVRKERQIPLRYSTGGGITGVPDG